jgi:hypothetical protein
MTVEGGEHCDRPYKMWREQKEKQKKQKRKKVGYYKT